MKPTLLFYLLSFALLSLGIPLLMGQDCGGLSSLQIQINDCNADPFCSIVYPADVEFNGEPYPGGGEDWTTDIPYFVYWDRELNPVQNITPNGQGQRLRIDYKERVDAGERGLLPDCVNTSEELSFQNNCFILPNQIEFNLYIENPTGGLTVSRIYSDPHPAPPCPLCSCEGTPNMRATSKCIAKPDPTDSIGILPGSWTECTVRYEYPCGFPDRMSSGPDFHIAGSINTAGQDAFEPWTGLPGAFHVWTRSPDYEVAQP